MSGKTQKVSTCDHWPVYFMSLQRENCIFKLLDKQQQQNTGNNHLLSLQNTPGNIISPLGSGGKENHSSGG